MEYISKSALVAGIEKSEKTNKECMLGLRNLDYYQGKVDALNDTLSFISTLEADLVDLEKEYKDFIKSDNGRSMFEIAKHFFELGLKAKEEKV
jgi:hypothetical protein